MASCAGQSSPSNGPILKRHALIEALKCGRLGGVGLSVYDEEEGVFFEDLSGPMLHDDELARLLTFPNVLITAHQAFLTEEALGEIDRVTIANLIAFAHGQPFLSGTSLRDQPAAEVAAPTSALRS
jgi:D-lactate dehydrogenase